MFVAQLVLVVLVKVIGLVIIAHVLVDIKTLGNNYVELFHNVLITVKSVKILAIVVIARVIELEIIVIAHLRLLIQIKCNVLLV